MIDACHFIFRQDSQNLGICDPVLSCESCRKTKLPSGKEPGLPTWDKFDAKLMNYT